MPSKSFRVVLTDELHRKCKIKSATTGKAVTEICRQALTDWVDKQHPIIRRAKTLMYIVPSHQTVHRLAT